MKKLHFAAAFLVLSAPGLSFTQETQPKTATTAKPKMVVVAPGDLSYAPLPAAFVSGKPSVENTGSLDVAVVAGDPSKTGSYTVYARCSDGYKIAPHWHPTTENVTVLQGGMGIAMGSKWESSALKSIPTQGFFSAPAGMRHYAQCNGDTLIEIYGNGPFKINFVSAAMRPAGKASAKEP